MTTSATDPTSPADPTREPTTGSTLRDNTIEAQEKLQNQSQQFQLAMARLQTEDAMEKSRIAFREAMAASDRENANRVAQFASK